MLIENKSVIAEPTHKLEPGELNNDVGGYEAVSGTSGHSIVIANKTVTSDYQNSKW
jgi:hypothetical protein